MNVFLSWSGELGKAASKDLDPYFKPEFRDVLDGIHCPQVLSSL